VFNSSAATIKHAQINWIFDAQQIKESTDKENVMKII
jgi:hypothetical protein